MTDTLIRPGVVVRVRGWPGTAGEKFVVQRIVNVDDSVYPRQVFAHRIELWPNANYPKGRTGAFRAFPLDLATYDEKGSRRWGAA